METQKKSARSYRLDNETNEKITRYAKDLGMSQNEFFALLISAYELQNNKVLVPDCAKDIETLASHMQSIQDAFNHVFDMLKQTEDRVRREYALRLENNDQQISSLLAQLEEKDAELKDKDVLNSRIRELEQSVSEKQDLINAYSARLPEQAEIDEKIKSLETEIASLSKANAELELAAAKARQEERDKLQPLLNKLVAKLEQQN